MTGVLASGYGFLSGPGWNLVADVQNMLSFAFMRNAFAALAILITRASLALAFYTPYPVSFYVTTLAFVLYLGVRAMGHGPGLRRLAAPASPAREPAADARPAATVRT